MPSGVFGVKQAFFFLEMRRLQALTTAYGGAHLRHQFRAGVRDGGEYAIEVLLDPAVVLITTAERLREPRHAITAVVLPVAVDCRGSAMGRGRCCRFVFANASVCH